jgi:hypothetical protein
MATSAIDKHAKINGQGISWVFRGFPSRGVHAHIRATASMPPMLLVSVPILNPGYDTARMRTKNQDIPMPAPMSSIFGIKFHIQENGGWRKIVGMLKSGSAANGSSS